MLLKWSILSSVFFRWFQFHKINFLKTSSYLVPTAVRSPTFHGSLLDANSNKEQLSGEIPKNYHRFAAFFDSLKMGGLSWSLPSFIHLVKKNEKSFSVFLPNNSCISCNIRCQFSTQHLLLWWPRRQLRPLLASSFQLVFWDRKRCDIETGLAFIPWFSGKLPTNFEETNLWRKLFSTSMILGGVLYIDKFINQTIWKIQCDRYFLGNSGRFLFSIRASSKLSPNWDANAFYSRAKNAFLHHAIQTCE